MGLKIFVLTKIFAESIFRKSYICREIKRKFPLNSPSLSASSFTLLHLSGAFECKQFCPHSLDKTSSRSLSQTHIFCIPLWMLTSAYSTSPSCIILQPTTILGLPTQASQINASVQVETKWKLERLETSQLYDGSDNVLVP